MRNFTKFSMLETLEPRQLLSGASLSHDLLLNIASVSTPVMGMTDFDGEIRAAGEKNLYGFTAASTGKITLDMSSLDGLLVPRIEIFNSQGHRVAVKSALASNDSVLNLKVKAGQLFFVRTAGYHSTTGGYTLKLNSMPYDDYGNATTTASTWNLQTNGKGGIAGMINYTGDADVLRIVPRKTGQIKLDMAKYGRNNALACELVLVDAQGNAISSDYDNGDGTGATLTVDATAGQPFFIKAVGHGSTLGRYTIRATTSAPVVVPVEPVTPSNDVTPQTNNIPVPTPGNTIIAQIVQTSLGVTLLVAGTNQADTITISSSGSTLTMTTSAGVQNFSGSFSAVVVYGFDGADAITIANSVTKYSYVDAGTGNDTIYCLGAGDGFANGGEGDDLIVTVGGGKISIMGGAGYDSVWNDTGDTMSDASTAEVAGTAIHTIAQFYQPYSSVPTNAQYIPLTIAGQKFTDPAGNGYSNGYKNYSFQPLFVGDPQYNDIHQGYVGDCYLLASLASVAMTDPDTIRQMTTSLGDGTYAVRFYRNGQAVYLRVDGDLPTYYNTLAFAGAGDQGEIWAPIIEKAYAYFRYGMNSYASIEGGWMSTVYQEMTNRAASSKSISGTGADAAAFIATNLAAGHAVTLGSKYNASSPVIGSHAYMVKAVETVAGATFVTVYNPWGVDGVSYDSNRSDGVLRLSLSTFAANFTTAVVCAA